VGWFIIPPHDAPNQTTTHEKLDMAVANYQETQSYLKFLPLLHDLPKQPFFIVYDLEADILYTDFGNPPQSANDSELTDDNIVIRYDDAKDVVGLTIFNASQR
jgi:uncharacterized protein YuzE